MTLQIVFLQKVGHGHGVLFLQCCRLMENKKIYKSCSVHFYASCNRFSDVSFKIYLQKVGQGHGVQFLQ